MMRTILKSSDKKQLEEVVLQEKAKMDEEERVNKLKEAKMSKEEKVTAKMVEDFTQNKKVSVKDAMSAGKFNTETLSKPNSLLPVHFNELGFIETLDDRKNFAITCMTDGKLRAAKPGELAKVIDILNKNHMLLTNRDTERRGVSVNVAIFGEDDLLARALKHQNMIDAQNADYNKPVEPVEIEGEINN